MTNFLHPWALLLGLLALAIPFVIHWLTRPKPATLPLSTIRFVQSAFEQRRHWQHRIRIRAPVAYIRI